MNWIYHGLANNDAAPTQVGWTRGGLLAALQASLGAVLLFLPMDDQTKFQLAMTLNPALGFLSIMGFSLLDRWMQNRGIKP